MRVRAPPPREEENRRSGPPRRFAGSSVSNGSCVAPMNNRDYYARIYRRLMLSLILALLIGGVIWLSS